MGQREGGERGKVERGREGGKGTEREKGSRGRRKKKREIGREGVCPHHHIPLHPQRSSKDDDRIPGLMRKLDAVCELRTRVQDICDCSFLYWHKVGMM